MDLIVVRHGRTTANASGLLLGRADPPLDDLGRAQARAIATLLGRPDRVVVSPLGRAIETAEALGRPLEIDERFVELDYGDWDGRPVADVPGEQWERWRRDLDFRPPDGETLAELARRVREGLDSLVATSAPDSLVVVVTHVSPMKAALCWALGVPDGTLWRTYVAPGSVTRIGVGARGPLLRSFNETGHLPTG